MAARPPPAVAPQYTLPAPFPPSDHSPPRPGNGSRHTTAKSPPPPPPHEKNGKSAAQYRTAPPHYPYSRSAHRKDRSAPPPPPSRSHYDRSYIPGTAGSADKAASGDRYTDRYKSRVGSGYCGISHPNRR